MSQTVQPGRSLPVPDYDPDTDPVLARLRSHGSSGGGRKALVAVAIVGLLVVAGWYAYSVYESRSREAKVEEELRAQAEAEPPPPPPISPLQEAEGWCVEILAATEFAGLPVIEGENGRFFVIYTARAGDSLGSVAKRYGASFGADPRGEVLELAKRQHIEQYGGRGLWVSDEIRLPIPIGP